MFSLLRHPFVTMPMRFLTRIAMSTVWGITLSPFELEVKVVFGAIVAGLAVLLSYSFWGFDRLPRMPSRFALYGLYVAGEALVIGTCVFAALGAYTGHVNVYALVLCAFGGALLPLYAQSVLFRDNMAKVAGSNPR